MEKSVNEPAVGSADLLRLLTSIFADQLTRLQSNDAPRDEEKRAKVFAIYAKALESLHSISIKLNAAGAADLDPILNGTGDLDAGSQATDTAELDRNLAQFIGNLVEAGKAG